MSHTASYANLLERYERELRRLNNNANRSRQQKALNSVSNRKSPPTVLILGDNNARDWNGHRKNERTNEPVSLQVRWIVNSSPGKKKNFQKVMREARARAWQAFHREANKENANKEKAYREYQRILSNAYEAYYRSEYGRLLGSSN